MCSLSDCIDRISRFSAPAALRCGKTQFHTVNCVVDDAHHVTICPLAPTSNWWIGPPPLLRLTCCCGKIKNPQEIRNRESTMMSSTLLSWSPSSQSRNVYDVFKNIFCFVFYFYFGKNQKEDGWRGIINDKQAAPFFFLLLPIVKDEIFEREKGRERLIHREKSRTQSYKWENAFGWWGKAGKIQHSSSSFVFFLLGSDRRYGQEPNWWAQDTGAPESTAQARSRLDSAKWGGMKLWLNRDYSSFSQFKKKNKSMK